MNTRFLHRLGLVALGLVAVLGLSSCASPVERRIANNPQIYGALSSSDKILVNQGRIREGMTKEGVFLSWGRPDYVATGRESGSSAEKWTYTGSRPVYTSTVGVGWNRLGYGPYGYGFGFYGPWDPFWGGYGPSVTYVPYEAASVQFRGNRVTKYMRNTSSSY